MEQLDRVPLGLEDTVDDFERTMIKSNKNVQIVGIVGRGGCGKTTLAKELYSRKCPMMKRSSFLSQVGSTAAEHALINLQKRLVGDLLPDSLVKDLPFCSIDDGKKIVASHLRSVRVLLVLDDVDHTNQLDALLPGKENLACGSLIIVTTRHSKLLTSWGICSIYEMKGLDPLHAEQLLCRHAFLGSSPPDEFKSYVEMFVRLCDGLPLMIKVLGQLLQGNSQEYWEAQLNKMNRIRPTDTKEMLKLHFLTFSEEEQDLFLDIACFFIGEEKSLAIAVWEGLGWNGMHSWEMLENKCFVELDEKKRIRMHNDLRDFGKEIAISMLSCRLWSPAQIVNIQKDKRAIRGIMAATSQFVVCSAHEEFPTYSAYYRPQFKHCMELIEKSSRSLNPLSASSHELDLFPRRPLKPLSASSHESEPLDFSSRPLKPLLASSHEPEELDFSSDPVKPWFTTSQVYNFFRSPFESMFEDESIITSHSQFRMPQDASSDMITSSSQLTMCQDTSSSIITSLSQLRMPQDVSSSLITSRSQFLMPQDASSSIITSRSQFLMPQDASSSIITSHSQDASSSIITNHSQDASSSIITMLMPQDASSSLITSRSNSNSHQFSYHHVKGKLIEKSSRPFKPPSLALSLSLSPTSPSSILEFYKKSPPLSSFPFRPLIFPPASSMGFSEKSSMFKPPPPRPLKLPTASSMGFYFLVVRGSDFTEEYAALSEDLVWLRWFDFNHSSLPPWLSLKNLRVLELYGALNLKELWNYSASEPSNLRELIISSSWGSSFESFPPSISNLIHLRKIALIGYMGDEFRIQRLPENFFRLRSLEHLELRHCKSLSTLPTEFGFLRSLQHLDLCSCEALRTLPLSFKNLKNLQYLDLAGCRKLAFRLDILEYMTRLENLYLSGCLKLEELPNIENQACLRQLHLQDTNLLDIPTNIDQVSKLQVLTIGSPLLTSLPHSLRDLSSLNSLSIIDCIDLKALPPSLEHLNLLECLYIKSSGVTSLAIWQFANLKTLKICDCPMGELDFGQRHSMKKLKLINVSQTLVTRISISEDCCPVLEILQLEQNDHLVKIEILPTTVKIVELTDCELLNDITGIDDLVNLQIFEKSGCPQLDKL